MKNTKTIEYERDIVHGILDWLHLNQFRVWRNNSGTHFVTKGDKGYAIRMSPKGTPDIVGMGKDGKFIGIEVKIPGQNPTVEQAEFLKYLNDVGGVGLCAHSIDEVISDFRYRGLVP